MVFYTDLCNNKRWSGIQHTKILRILEIFYLCFMYYFYDVIRFIRSSVSSNGLHSIPQSNSSAWWQILIYFTLSSTSSSLLCLALFSFFCIFFLLFSLFYLIFRLFVSRPWFSLCDFEKGGKNYTSYCRRNSHLYNG